MNGFLPSHVEWIFQCINHSTITNFKTIKNENRTQKVEDSRGLYSLVERHYVFPVVVFLNYINLGDAGYYSGVAATSENIRKSSGEKAGESDHHR